MREATSGDSNKSRDPINASIMISFHAPAYLPPRQASAANTCSIFANKNRLATCSPYIQDGNSKKNPPSLLLKRWAD